MSYPALSYPDERRRMSLPMRLAIAIPLAAAGVMLAYWGWTQHEPKYFTQADLERGIGDGLTDRLGVSVQVSCPPKIAIEKGKIVDCVASDSTSERYVRVTQDDNAGHYTYVMTDQRPAGSVDSTTTTTSIEYRISPYPSSEFD